MKFKFLILLLLAAVAVSPVLAQSTTGNSVTYNGFNFSWDSSLGPNVNISQYPGDPPDQQQPGGPDPRHTQFVLYNERPASESIFDATASIRVYRTADLATYDFPKRQLEQLQTLLKDRPDLAPFTTVKENASENNLPFLPVVPAAQVIRARVQYVDTLAMRGISYATAYRQDVSPFTASEFMVVFQGLSNDGVYYVSVIFRPAVKGFPAIPEAIDMDTFARQLTKYFEETIAKLNKAAPTDFTPALTTFEGMVNSITFAAR
jgi:hypothetical protein